MAGRWLAAAAAIALLGGATLTGCGGTEHADETSATRATAVHAAQHFLAGYVSPAGRVIRRDQGGDTVSEGQGYALLLAYAADDRSLFAQIWRWTQVNLQQPDSLFAYRWQDGHIVDAEPAADADTQIAWALDLAGNGWSVPADTSAAKRIAIAIADAEIGYDDQGRPTLAAGPWAVAAGSPTQVEPGYWTFPAYAALANLTGDHRWQDLTAADSSHLETLADGGVQLAPDWARLGHGANPAAEPAPQNDSAPVAGEDGLRALVWTSCQPATQTLDSRWWHLIGSTAQSGPLTRDLDGQPADREQAPLSLVAAAAAAIAAGDRLSARSLLADAGKVAAEYPTYYGDAWNGLGHILLTTNLISGCTP
ncbi:MAG TPA: glycosyl hydrolase family 8 [Mycobacteriales bacterium]|jgi:endoglucanase|nr:glycosyl hydrolase family 8 [Mycobacteriales bacterium]